MNEENKFIYNNLDAYKILATPSISQVNVLNYNQLTFST